MGSSQDSAWWVSAKSGAWSKNRGLCLPPGPRGRKNRAAMSEPESLGLESHREGETVWWSRQVDSAVSAGWNRVEWGEKRGTWYSPSLPLPGNRVGQECLHLPSSHLATWLTSCLVSPLLNGDCYTKPALLCWPFVSGRGHQRSGQSQAMSPGALSANHWLLIHAHACVPPVSLSLCLRLVHYLSISLLLFPWSLSVHIHTPLL